MAIITDEKLGIWYLVTAVVLVAASLLIGNVCIYLENIDCYEPLLNSSNPAYVYALFLLIGSIMKFGRSRRVASTTTSVAGQWLAILFFIIGGFFFLLLAASSNIRVGF